ncbi:MAG TPA: transcription elongation factor GreA [Polyangiaceae bacterium]|nr:transcription elongation factor GreA [Polyangiaceae bacterium]
MWGKAFDCAQAVPFDSGQGARSTVGYLSPIAQAVKTPGKRGPQTVDPRGGWVMLPLAAMTERVPMTPAGAEKLRRELGRLKEERPKISRDIGVAREHGDLSENAEYHAAKERQGMVEAQIKDIEDKLSRAEVIDPTKLSGTKVRFGASITLLNTDTDEEVTYQIVGADEANIDEGTISVSAPLARALIGKEVGDEIKVKLPGGERNYEVVSVEFK